MPSKTASNGRLRLDPVLLTSSLMISSLVKAESPLPRSPQTRKPKGRFWPYRPTSSVKARFRGALAEEPILSPSASGMSHLVYRDGTKNGNN